MQLKIYSREVKSLKYLGLIIDNNDNDNDNEIVYFDINNKTKNIEQKQLLE